MTARLFHGLLLGVLIALVAAFLELRALFAHYPYHQDWGVLAEWLPAHLSVGTLSGLLAAALAGRLSQAHLIQRNRGLAIGSLLIPAWVACAIALSSPHGMLTGLPIRGPLGIAAGLATWYGFSRFSLSSLGWTISGFFTPWFSAMACTICLFAIVSLGALPPVSAHSVKASSALASKDAQLATPNILLIVLDGVRADQLGCFGASRPVSPTLDSLANQGVLCTQAFAAAPWAVPSHASIQTGLHPASHGAGWTHPRLAGGPNTSRSASDPITLAEALARRGFQTCGVSDSPWLTARRGMTQGFAQYYDYSSAQLAEHLLLPRLIDRCSQRFLDRPQIQVEQPDQGGQRIVQTALHWLEHERREKHPFFLSLNLREALPPFLPRGDQEAFARFLPHNFDLRSLDSAYFGEASERWAWNSRERALLSQEAEVQLALYNAAIAYQDQLLSTLLDGLLSLQLLEDTLVVVTSSHGDEFNEQGRFGAELSLSDRALHVPLIFRLPKALPAQGRIETLVSLVDIKPTLLDFVDQFQEPPQVTLAGELAAEGFSLYPALTGQAVFTRDWVLASTDNPTPHLAQYPNFSTDSNFRLAEQSMHSISMLRSGSLKYFRYGDGSEVLLDLAIDPDELAAETLQTDASVMSWLAVYRLRLNRITNGHTVRRALLQGPGSGARSIEYLQRTLPKTQAQRFSNP